MNENPGPEFFERIALVLKAMADPVRLRLLNVLQSGELCVGDLVERIGTSQANISKHLGVLKRAGLVSCRRDGHMILYAIEDPAIFGICGAVSQSIERRLVVEQRIMQASPRHFNEGTRSSNA